jgi:hypothetical protein
VEINPIKYRTNTYNGILRRAINLQAKLILEWELHISLPYSIIEHYAQNEYFYKLKTVIDGT